MDPEELAFARAMLAAPHDASRRLVYADWLEECGDARAGLVRAAEGWEVMGRGSVLWLVGPALRGRRTRYSFCQIYGRRGRDFIAYIHRFDGVASHAVESWLIRPDGTSPDDPHNWAWLLSLALARGLKVPGLEITDGPR